MASRFDLPAIARHRMRAQRLWGTPHASAQDALRWLTAVQAQEFPYAEWSLAQRSKGETKASLDAAVNDGRVLRTHVLRPTWHFVAPQDLRWLMRLSGPRVAARYARRYRELELDPKLLARANDLIAEAVAERHLTRREIAAVLARRRISTDGQRMAWIVMRAELDSVVCSGEMSGKQQTYASFDERVDARKGPEGEEALAELARRYFTARGPATLKDFVWWSGLATNDARHAVEMADPKLQRLAINDRAYWYADNSPQPRRAAARADLVQCYDETIISYTESRHDVLAAAGRLAAPASVEGFLHAILYDGRMLGRWRAIAGREDLRVETLIDRRLGAAERKAVDDAIGRYLRFLDDR